MIENLYPLLGKNRRYNAKMYSIFLIIHDAVLYYLLSFLNIIAEIWVCLKLKHELKNKMKRSENLSIENRKKREIIYSRKKKEKQF